MLELSRRLGQSIIIGNDIEVRILAINGNQIRIGIDAPKSVNIVREEIIDRPRKSLPQTNASPTGIAPPEGQQKRSRLSLYGRNITRNGNF